MRRLLQQSFVATLDQMEALVAALVGSSFHQGGANVAPCGGGHQGRTSVRCSKAIAQEAYNLEQDHNKQHPIAPISNEEAKRRVKLLPAAATLERLGRFEGLIALLEVRALPAAAGDREGVQSVPWG